MKATEAWQVVTAPPLRTVALAALADLVPEAEAHEPAAAVLLQARRDLEPTAWPVALGTVRTQPAPCDRALLRLVDGLALLDLELLAVAAALAAQLNPAAARAIAWLQGDWPEGQGTASLPTLGLLAAAAGPLVDHADAALLQLLHGAAARAGLWVAAPADVPSQRTIHLPAMLLPWLAPAVVGLASQSILLAPQQEQVLHAALPQLRAGRALLLRSPDPDDARAAATWLAQALACELLPITTAEWPDGAALLARAGQVLPVLQATGAPLPVPPRPVPLVVLAGPEGSVSLPGHRLVELRLPLPSVAERAAHWQHLGWPDPHALARRCRCGLSQIQHLHDTAQLQASARGLAVATVQDLLQAQAASAAAAFEGLGQLIDTSQPPQLVLNRANEQALQHLLARCRVREQLHDHAQQRPRSAVCALLSGPSGTGKTLAASWLAARLQLPLVAIDLAALTSKWIGETEKNLAQVFSRAEGLGVVLLFDEADSLFGARTDTHSSNDRFANQQTNYLLSRLERFDGIAVLTSNARHRLDGAFARRIDALIEFRLPEVDERRALWALHLGHDAPSSWLDRLASLVELPGGHVRSAALCAQALALDAGRVMVPEDVLVGLRAEYAKLDRSAAAELLRPWH